MPQLLSGAHLARHHHQHVLHLAGQGYFLTWIDREMEHVLDALWSSSPSRAFALHEQMSELIMNALGRHIPQVRVHACAPLPPWSPRLDQLLLPWDVRQLPGGHLNRSYAALTFHPWQGGCAVCSLNQNGRYIGAERPCGRQQTNVRKPA
ncbi:hypothetical protein [Desulfonatronum thioautotrophicum]|uniref:hypothetical protein n=1 Tax=Desulfonatronum thioautotrophicum TaxID=617001 RepID=UPI0005EBCC9E|nr:hypothetical protein [Desulfonatronum thioautotrophicum]